LRFVVSTPSALHPRSLRLLHASSILPFLSTPKLEQNDRLNQRSGFGKRFACQSSFSLSLLPSSPSPFPDFVFFPLVLSTGFQHFVDDTPGYPPVPCLQPFASIIRLFSVSSTACPSFGDTHSIGPFFTPKSTVQLQLVPSHVASSRVSFNNSYAPRHRRPLAFLCGFSLNMNKLANMRHWSERMSPNFVMGSRPTNMPMNVLNAHPKNGAQSGGPISSPQAADATIHYSFNVPFASDLAGPNTEDIVHATTDAVLRWTHAADAPDDVQVHELPVHGQNLASLGRLCRDLSIGPLPIEAHVVSSYPKNGRGQVTTVCLSGSPELVHKSRETILNEIPISMVWITRICFLLMLHSSRRHLKSISYL
jgi:hypothetical protein